MKAIRYKVVVSVDPVHKYMDQLIEEIWIPELNVYFNEKSRCFYSDQPRGDGNEIEIR